MLQTITECLFYICVIFVIPITIGSLVDFIQYKIRQKENKKITRKEKYSAMFEYMKQN